MMLKGSDGRDLAVRELGKKSKSDPCKGKCKGKGQKCIVTGDSYECVDSKCHQERTASFHFYPHSSFLPSYPRPTQTPQKLPSLEVSRSSVVSLNSSHSSNPLMHLIPFSNLNSQLAVAQTVTVAQTVAQAVAQAVTAQAVTAAVLTVDVSLSMMYLTIALNAK
mmetsp:Transcript_22314/g.44962  ORF Transcript_22314/g.44962 Transcript_22314/m.44962 type:complete len:164 (-) Transcript_22314:1619-2110(-)